MSYAYTYPRPAVTVDIVIFGHDSKDEKNGLSLLLIRRGVEPFKDEWALPGGFLKMDETLDEAARRELSEESGVDNVYLEQLYTFGALERDPRARTVSVAYFALVETSKFKLKASTDAVEAKWFPIGRQPKLAFDHSRIVKVAIQRLQNKIRYEPIGFELLPKQFTLSQLQELHEAVLGETLDKRNFRKKILSFGVLKELGRKVENVRHRSPQLFSFDETKFKSLTKKGRKYEI